MPKQDGQKMLPEELERRIGEWYERIKPGLMAKDISFDALELLMQTPPYASYAPEAHTIRRHPKGYNQRTS